MLLNEEQTLIRDTARAFAQEQVLPHIRAWEAAGEIPRPLLAEMGRMGFMGMTVPADWGGAGADMISYVLALEEIAAADGGLSTVMSVNNSPDCAALLAYGSAEQKETWLKPLARGEVLGAFCLTEPHAGDGQLRAGPEVGLDEGADGERLVAPRHLPRGRARAGLEATAVHARTAPDRALLDWTGRGRIQRGVHLGLADAAVVDRVKEAVPRLRGNRQRPLVVGIGEALVHPAVDARLGDADGGRAGDRDRQADGAGLLDPRPACHLAVAVERVDAGRARVVRIGLAARMDAGHARAHVIALDHGRVAHLDTGHVRDRVERTRPAVEGDAKRAGAGLAGRGGELRIGHGREYDAHAISP